MELIWSKPARYSLLEIASFVEKNFSQQVAEKVVQEIRQTAESLRITLNIGRKVDNLPTDKIIRRLPYKQNQFYYYQEADAVIIIYVWDSRRNPKTLKEKLIAYCEKQE